MILLIAAGLLTAAELVSVSLFLREFSEQQASRSREAIEQAASLLPRVADWVRAQAENAAPVPTPSIDPFDRVTLEDAPVGQALLLLNYEHQAADTPYRSRHAIYVSEAATETRRATLVEPLAEPGLAPWVAGQRTNLGRLGAAIAARIRERGQP